MMLLKIIVAGQIDFWGIREKIIHKLDSLSSISVGCLAYIDSSRLVNIFPNICQYNWYK